MGWEHDNDDGRGHGIHDNGWHYQNSGCTSTTRRQVEAASIGASRQGAVIPPCVHTKAVVAVKINSEGRYPTTVSIVVGANSPLHFIENTHHYFPSYY
jgi:hypothetical protein